MFRRKKADVENPSRFSPVDSGINVASSSNESAISDASSNDSNESPNFNSKFQNIQNDQNQIEEKALVINSKFKLF